MAKLPVLMQVPCRLFTNIGLNLCGLILVKCMANKRARMKVWVAIFLCLNTKAVTELVPGYSADDFMLVMKLIAAVRESPHSCTSIFQGTHWLQCTKKYLLIS